MFAGYDWDGSVIVSRTRNLYINKECTVVVHDGKPESLFTESEVRAILKDLEKRVEDAFMGKVLMDFESVIDGRESPNKTK